MKFRTTVFASLLLLAGIIAGCEKKQFCAIPCGEQGKLRINVENQTGYELENFTIAGREFGTLNSNSSTCFMAFDSFTFDDNGPLETCSGEVNGRMLTEEPALYIECFTNQHEVKKGDFNLVLSISNIDGQEYLALSNKQ
jgi:hypothetical protein